MIEEVIKMAVFASYLILIACVGFLWFLLAPAYKKLMDKILEYMKNDDF